MIPDRIDIQRLSEWELDPVLGREVGALLRRCFPGFPPRPYFKLPPHLRYLVRREDELVAHAGIEHRVLRVGDLVVRTFGVVDLCVSEAHRSRGIATALLAEIVASARSSGLDFVVLFADRHDLYLEAGWKLVGNRCSWVKIDGHRTLGIAGPTSLQHCLMVKAVGELDWPSGDVDLLGHVF